jgi:hypothetical protein
MNDRLSVEKIIMDILCKNKIYPTEGRYVIVSEYVDIVVHLDKALENNIVKEIKSSLPSILYAIS